MPSSARILCLDTCAILDILRDPIRDDIHANNQEASLALLLEAESGTNLQAVITELVSTEFRDRVQQVQDEAEQSIERLRLQVDKIDKLATLHGSPGSARTGHWIGHVRRCRDVAERWLRASMVAPRSEKIELAAFRRVMEARSPARKGKESVADCTIIETYLDFIRRLRDANVSTPIVFVSSNTSDYAGRSRSEIKDDIKSDFETLSLEYAPNMGSAKYRLGL